MPPSTATTLETCCVEAITSNEQLSSDQLASLNNLMCTFITSQDSNEDSKDMSSSQSSQVTNAQESFKSITNASSAPTPSINNIDSSVHQCSVCHETGHTPDSCPALLTDPDDCPASDDHVFLSNDCDSNLSPHERHLLGLNC